MASNKNLPERPFGHIPYSGVVGCDWTAVDSQRMEIGMSAQNPWMENFGATNHDPQLSTGPGNLSQGNPNFFVTDSYSPGDWKDSKPGA